MCPVPVGAVFVCPVPVGAVEPLRVAGPTARASCPNHAGPDVAPTRPLVATGQPPSHAFHTFYACLRACAATPHCGWRGAGRHGNVRRSCDSWFHVVLLLWLAPCVGFLGPPGPVRPACAFVHTLSVAGSRVGAASARAVLRRRDSGNRAAPSPSRVLRWGGLVVSTVASVGSVQVSALVAMEGVPGPPLGCHHR